MLVWRSIYVTNLKEVKRMRKIATLFVLIITILMVFTGAVSAAPEVVTVVLDENGDNATVTCPGDEVTVGVGVSANNTTLIDPFVAIEVDPSTGLAVDADNARMTTDGINWILNSDPVLGGFLVWNPLTNSGIWDLGTLMSDDMQAALIIPAMVTDIGEITVNADLISYEPQFRQYVVVGEDSYTFLSVPCRPPCPHGQTVPMQATGSPLAVAALGLLSIIGGAVYGKLR